MIYVARQLGHDARLTLGTYGHVIDELDEAPRIAAEDAIRAARDTPCVSGVSEAVSAAAGSGGAGMRRAPGSGAWCAWAIQDSHLGPLPYQGHLGVE